ncbi:nitrate ABC transporter substrate-binding protein [Aphanothece sacrum FPU3]|nr:nitrate ABC transporter substrate-binding protein [Aphanothece sacrum FPU3]
MVLAMTLTNCITEPPLPLKIGFNLWPGYETLYLARDLGYYDKKPIKLIDYPSGTEVVRAYRNQEIEAAGLSMDQALVLAETKKNLKIIAIIDVSDGGDVILGRPEITNMKGLKGKRVGLEATSLGAFLIARALEKNGMSVKDIQIVSLELSEHERAYKQAEVDAVVTFGPAKIKVLEAGARLLFDSSQIPGEIVDVIVVSEDVINKNYDRIQSLVNGQFQALDYLEKNPQDAGIRMAKRTQVKPKQILNSFKGLRQPNLEENQRLFDQSDPSFVNGMRKLVKIMIANKLLSQDIDPANLIDDRFIKNAKFSTHKND